MDVKTRVDLNRLLSFGVTVTMLAAKENHALSFFNMLYKTEQTYHAWTAHDLVSPSLPTGGDKGSRWSGQREERKGQREERSGGREDGSGLARLNSL